MARASSALVLAAALGTVACSREATCPPTALDCDFYIAHYTSVRVLVTRGAALAVPDAEVRLEFLRDTLIVYAAVDTTDLTGAASTTAYGRGMPASERVRVSVSDLAAPASPSVVSYHTVPWQREGRPRLREITVRLPDS